tara:strand:- start:402 stop:1280 length:879 start_codon:yes stop_codon:yes gene_type:complete
LVVKEEIMSGYIDIVCNPFTPWVVSKGLMGVDDTFKEQIRMSNSDKDGVEIVDYLKMMDKAGIERSLLIAHRCGDLNVKGSHHIPYEYVRDICAQYPDRFSGLAGIDTTKGMRQLKELEVAVKEYGFVGAHWYPHWFSIEPNAPQIYPVYAKCCELSIPIMMQVGQNLVYSQERRLPSIARPILLDQVAIDFPELPIVGIHIGVPWTDEMIAMCWKHENIYTAGDAYAPKHWPKQFVHYANSYGSHKVMFGTDWPVIHPERAVKEVEEFKMRNSSHAMLMRENALRVFSRIQ